MKKTQSEKDRITTGGALPRGASLVAALAFIALCLTALAAETPAPPPSATQAAQGPVMRKGPYLLYTNKNTTMTLLWQTFATPSKATVEWGATAEYGHGPVTVVEHSAFVDGHQFSYTIGGLAPGKRCFWRVTVNGVPFTGSFIAPPEMSASSVTFYAYGDGASGKDAQNRLLQAMLKDKEGAPDERQTMILHTGDYVPWGLTELSWDTDLFNRTMPFTTEAFAAFPVIGALGSREGYSQSAGNGFMLRQNTGQYFRKYFPYPMYRLVTRNYYSFDYGPLHVAVLDTWSYPGLPGREIPDTRQMEWLREDLKISKKTWKIVVVNAPVRGCAYQSKEVQDLFAPVIESAATDVRLVLQGREPQYSRTEKNNGIYPITYLALGASGTPGDQVPCPQENAPYVAKTAKGQHFARFHVSGNLMTVTVMKADGSVAETFTINRELKPQKKEPAKRGS